MIALPKCDVGWIVLNVEKVLLTNALAWESEAALSQGEVVLIKRSQL